DSIFLPHTSSDFNAATDQQIIGVEEISSAAAQQAVAIDIHNQSEGFFVIGSSSDDSFVGGIGDNSFQAAGVNASIDGGSVGNRAVYFGTRSDYSFSVNGSTYTIQDNRGGSPDGTDHLTNVSLFEFADGTFTASALIGNPPSQPVDSNASSNAVAENAANGTPV